MLVIKILDVQTREIYWTEELFLIVSAQTGRAIVIGAVPITID